eukprot:4367338-Pyramimonas_sp.AAC.1
MADTFTNCRLACQAETCEPMPSSAPAPLSTALNQIDRNAIQSDHVQQPDEPISDTTISDRRQSRLPDGASPTTTQALDQAHHAWASHLTRTYRP